MREEEKLDALTTMEVNYSEPTNQSTKKSPKRESRQSTNTLILSLKKEQETSNAMKSRSCKKRDSLLLASPNPKQEIR
jgi:hypothetical protein